MLDAKDISIIKDIVCQANQELGSELRKEFREANEELRNELRSEFREANEELRKEFREANEELRKEFREVNEELRKEFREVNEETKTSLKGYFHECMEKNNELIFDEMERYYQLTRQDIKSLEQKVTEMDNYYRIRKLEDDVSGKVLKISDRHEVMLNKHEKDIQELQQKVAMMG